MSAREAAKLEEGYDVVSGWRRVARRELAPLLERLRPPPRHWIHLVDAPWLRDLILRWMPQLGYLFT